MEQDRRASIGERVEMKEEIGSGCYGKVYRAELVDDITGKANSYAAKVINLQRTKKDFIKKFLPRELQVSCEIDHPNVVKTHDVITTPKRIVMFMDFASKGDLLGFCRLRGALPEAQCKEMLYQIADGLNYLHEKNIIHRDLKCENILINQDNKCQIADFGFARKMEEDSISSTFCGSAAYAAPELLKGKMYSSFASDVWSLGVIFYVMLTHRMPFRDNSIALLLADQERGFPNISREVSDRTSWEAKGLLRNMLTYKSHERISMAETVNDNWFKRATVPTDQNNFFQRFLQ